MQVHNALLSSTTLPYRPPATTASGEPADGKAATPTTASARPVATTSTGAAGVSTVPPAGSGSGESQPLTVEGLLEAWGSDNEKYDLNSDGTVNVRDLLALLAKLSDTTLADDPQIGQAPVEPETVTDEIGEPLTIEGLEAAWGTDDERYDLNGDGTVNVRDLLALLAQMSHSPPAGDGEVADSGGAPGIDPENPGGVTPPLPPEEDELTVEGLTEAWGTDDPRYDLNLDGTVNVQDLLALLAQMSEAKPETEPDVAPAVVTSNQDVPADDVLGEPTPLDLLLKAWGTDNPDYDLNLDGVVDVQDLLAMLAELSGGQSGSFTDRAAVTGTVPSTAASLVSRLEAAGYTEQPPSNIHELISQLNLPATERASVLSQLADRYPQGLGLDIIG
jgi:Ca2+-binding EF-hand superfamily protein